MAGAEGEEGQNHGGIPWGYCTGAWSGSFGLLSGASLSVNGNSGTISASGDLYDYWSGTSTSVTLSVSVAGDGSSYRGNDNERYRWPTGSFNYHSNGTSHDGTATITLNGTTFSNGWGSYGTSNSGTMYMYQY